MINKTIITDDAIFKTLDLKWIGRLVCTTDRGPLTLQIRKGESTYHLCLDSVPLDKKINDELMALLFPKKEVEIPQVNKLTWNGQPIEPDSKEAKILQSVAPIVKAKPKGRPKGTKNK